MKKLTALVLVALMALNLNLFSQDMANNASVDKTTAAFDDVKFDDVKKFSKDNVDVFFKIENKYNHKFLVMEIVNNTKQLIIPFEGSEMIDEISKMCFIWTSKKDSSEITYSEPYWSTQMARSFKFDQKVKTPRGTLAEFKPGLTYKCLVDLTSCMPKYEAGNYEFGFEFWYKMEGESQIKKMEEKFPLIIK